MRQSVLYVGMDLHPPYNELCAKIVQSLTSNFPEEWNYSVLSIPNPGCELSPPPNNNYHSVPGNSVLISALLLPLYLIKIARKGYVVHFLMPARHYNYLTLLFCICNLMKIPTVYTLLKNNDEQILCGRRADVVIAQTPAAYERCKTLLKNHAQTHFICAGSAESIVPSIHRKKKEILFIGVPWKRGDLERRGVLLLFEVIKQVLLQDKDVHFTLLNRALVNAQILDTLAADIPSENVTLQHGSVPHINQYFSSSSAFLILHLDNLCPDPPLSAIEACACGCPVVTTKYNSWANKIDSSGAGKCVNCDSLAIAQGIFQVLSRLEVYSRNALDLAMEHYEEVKFCQSYYKIYLKFQG